MQLQLTLVAAFAAIALAAPPTYPSEIYEAPQLANITTTEPSAVEIAEPLVSKRGETAGTTWCEHSMHTKPCLRFDFEVAECYNLARYWNDKMSSIFPTSRTDRCIVYENTNCKGKRLTVSWPGINRLADKGMNDKVSSIECFKYMAS